MPHLNHISATLKTFESTVKFEKCHISHIATDILRKIKTHFKIYQSAVCYLVFCSMWHFKKNVK